MLNNEHGILNFEVLKGLFRYIAFENLSQRVVLDFIRKEKTSIKNEYAQRWLRCYVEPVEMLSKPPLGILILKYRMQ
jgi:hypothetical protein